MDVFGGAPRFLAYPRTFTVQSGADALLKCQITGDPQPSIAWEKDKAPITPAGRFRVQAEGNMYSLLVSRVTPEDSGQYICKAKNSVGETYAAATLKVEPGELRCEGHPDDRAPVFLARPLSLRVSRGEDVSFSCRVLGQPGPVLEWEKDGRKLSDLFESSHFCVGKEPEDWHFLRIFGSRPPDGGVYVCRARNRAGEALAAAVLLVDPWSREPRDGPSLGPPRNCLLLSCCDKAPEQPGPRHRHAAGPEPEPWAALTNGEAAPSAPRAKAFAVSEGKHAKFRCYVTGKPKPEIMWKKDGKAVVPGRRHLAYEDREGYFILKVLYCKPQDRGLYVCTASNTAGQTLSAVQLCVREHRVRFQVQLEDVEVQEREDAVLECRVPLETIPTAWYLEDKPLQPSPKYLMEERGRVRRLTIRDARTDDDGIYLCEMQDQGRSIAEVSVRGMIVKRLPRKLDVMEGENAAFCVETREAVEGICWRRNGQELQESPCTVLKSFGKTHLLVLVHVTREDAGIIAFAVGDSETLAQLRVKCAKRVPPSTPVAACMSTEHSNAALLTWCPAPDVHRSPPGAYVLERQEAGTAEWVQCLTTDTAGAVEVLGDSVPAEADYRFRLCAVNKYGCSAHVEFPGAAHLVPLARVERALQDAVVQEGEDAIFSLELSALVRGAWFLNGARVLEEKEQEGRRCCIWHSKTEHALQIRGVRLTEDGAEVRFVAHGLQDVAMLHVQAPQVRIVAVPEAQRVQTLPVGLPLLLECEVSRPDAPVRWLKDGEAVPGGDAITIQAEGCMRRLLVRSACPLHSGTYACDTGNDVVTFAVTVTEPPVRVVSSNETAAHTYVASERVELVCELSRPDAPVQWYKDGVEVEESERLVLQRSGPCCRLVLPSAQPPDTGEYVCDAGGDSIFYNVTVAELPVRVVSSNEAAVHAYVASERVELVCELSRPSAPVQWYKDGVEVEESERLVLQREGPCSRLILPSAQPPDTGEYVCNVGGDSVFYSITVAEPPVRVVSSNEAAAHTYVASERVELWYKDGVEVEESERLVLQREGPCCRLVLPSAQPPDTGEYVCDVGGDSIFYNVTVAEPPVRVVSSNKAAAHTYVASEHVELVCELSRPDAPVQWYKDGVEVEESERLVLQREGPCCRLVLPSAQPPDTGEYVCDAGGDSVFYNVTVAEPPVRVISSNEAAVHTYVASERVELVCELSRPSAPVQWYKDGVEVEESERLVLQREGPCCRLILPSAQPPDTGEYVCDVGGDSVFYNVTVAEPPVRVISSNEAAAHAYAASERVELVCELSRPNAPVQWYKDGVEVEESDRLVLQRSGPCCRLVLPSAQPLDAGEYVCDAGGDSVFYSVTVAEPRVRILCPQERVLELRVLVLERVELACELSVADAPVRWFKDGLEVDETDDLLLMAEGTRRCLVLPRAGTEDAGEYICETRDESVSFDVRVSEPPVRILQPWKAPPTLQACTGETVTLACELSRVSASVQWTKDGTWLEAGGSLILEEEGTHRRLVIPAAGPEHSGKYVCNVGNDARTFTVQVSDPCVRILGQGDLQTQRHCQAGEDLVLEVQLSHAHGEAKWYKDGEKLQDTGRVRVEEDGARRALIVLGVESHDVGEYLCDTRDDSLIFYVTVEVPRVVEIISELRNLTVMEGEDATFKCVVSPEDVALTWQLGGQVVAPSERLVVSTNGLCHGLTIRQCQPGDATTVTANAEGLVSAARLSVQEAEVLFVQKLQDMVVEELQDACLEVELSHAGAEVQWLKQGVLLQPGAKYQLQEAGRRRTLTICSLSPSDRGTYRCETLHDRTQAKLSVEPRKVMVRRPLSDVETFEKEMATFELELSHAGVAGAWARDGVRVKPGPACRLSATGCTHSLTLLALTLEDSGTVTFTADSLRCSARLTVRERPVTMVKTLRDVGVPETGAVSFECELSRASVEVKWYKDGTELRAGPTCRLYSVGRRRILQLSHCGLPDAGVYTCDASDCQTSATLAVYGVAVPCWRHLAPGAPSQPSPLGPRPGLAERRVHVLRELEAVRVREGENAVFTCEVSHEDVPGEWFRDGEKIKVSGTVKIRQEGTRHFLLMCSVRPEDAGQIRFVAKTAASDASLQVEALPIRIVRPLRDKTVLAQHKATLECTVSHTRGRVRWFRGDTEIFGGIFGGGDKYEICNLDCYRTLVIHHVGPEDEATYTCDALDDRSSARLLVEAESVQVVRGLRSVEVVAPGEARFECEVSAALPAPPRWSLNGETLRAGAHVAMESAGRVHRLTLRHTSAGMSGVVKVAVGNARSKAQLTVRGR
ncbi:PREDICTED: obscurin-like protein 1 [Gavialis gangeticus]|uniref:obscurin-like protein 1 n=1 Tax=Gavialis gangeticus TaxID=94835 RepID=UPI00092E6D88|nr:PREDICTED: obscurin-like protein 1 [Gavialis gangeticus]